MKGMPSLLLENQGNARFADAAEKGGPFFKRQMNLRGCGDEVGWSLLGSQAPNAGDNWR